MKSKKVRRAKTLKTQRKRKMHKRYGTEKGDSDSVWEKRRLGHRRRKHYKAVVNEEGDVWAKKIKTIEF